MDRPRRTCAQKAKQPPISANAASRNRKSVVCIKEALIYSHTCIQQQGRFMKLVFGEAVRATQSLPVIKHKGPAVSPLRGLAAFVPWLCFRSWQGNDPYLRAAPHQETKSTKCSRANKSALP